MFTASKTRHFSGIVNYLNPYCGSKTVDDNIKLSNDEGVIDSWVHHMIKYDVEENGNTGAIYIMDKKFTSLNVVDDIATEYSVGVIGPIKSNRKHLPKKMFKNPIWKDIVKNMDRGDYVQLVCEQDELLRLDIVKDTKLVMLLSNCVPSNCRSIISRRVNNTEVNYLVPSAMMLYNNNMGNVDAVSTHIKQHSMDFAHLRKNERTKEFILDVYLNNCIMVFSEAMYPRCEFVKSKEIRLQLCDQLLALCAAKTKKKPSCGYMKRDKRREIIQKSLDELSILEIDSHKLEKVRNQRYCVICGKRKRTVCSHCKVGGKMQVGICSDNCFKILHKIEEY